MKRIYTYTHKDKFGVLWRFEGARPISILADKVKADMEWPLEPPEPVELGGGGIRRNIVTNKNVTDKGSKKCQNVKRKPDSK